MTRRVSLASLFVISVGMFAARLLAQDGAPPTVLTQFVEWTEIAQVGGGDPDVNSKNGRPTHVTFETSNLSLAPDGRSISITLVYSVKEGQKNFTHLKKEGNVVLPVPEGFKVKSVGEGKGHANYSETYQSEDHEWHDVKEKVKDSFVSSLEVKFDGKGDDDKGNARVKFTLAMPVELERIQP
jgi:hypothetical protein